MITMGLRVWIATWLAAFACVAGGVHADDVTVTTMAPKRGYVGEPIVVQVITRNARTASTPRIDPSPDYDVRYAGLEQSNSSMQIIVNGRMVEQQTYYASKFLVTARRAGSITIPPLEVTADGKKYTTKPVQIAIVEPAKGEDFGLQLVAARTLPKKCYVGQYIPVAMEFLVGRNANDVRFSLPDLPEGFSWEYGPDPRPEAMQRSNSFNEQYVLLEVGGENLIARRGQGMLNGKQVTSFSFDLFLVPQRAGQVQVGAARADFNAVMGQRRPQLSDAFFDDRQITERQFAASQPFEIQVLDLPVSGRPEGFTGLIGAYSVLSSVDVREVSIGEPMKLTVNITGTPPIDRVPPLDLTRQPGFNTKGADGRRQFKYSREPSLPNSDSRAVRFQTTVRVRDSSVTAVPSIELPYFDPDDGKYAIARSAPIALKVRPGGELQVDDSIESDSADVDPVAARVGPRPMYEGDFAFHGATRFDLSRAVRQPQVLASMLIPPLLCCAICGGVLLRRRTLADLQRHRRRKAVRTSKRRLHRAARNSDVAGSIAGALGNLAADWCGKTEGSLTSREAVELLGYESGPAAAAIGDVLRMCDAARFASSNTTDPAALLSQAAEALAVAKRELGRKAIRGKGGVT